MHLLMKVIHFSLDFEKYFFAVNNRMVLLRLISYCWATSFIYAGLVHPTTAHMLSATMLNFVSSLCIIELSNEQWRNKWKLLLHINTHVNILQVQCKISTFLEFLLSGQLLCDRSCSVSYLPDPDSFLQVCCHFCDPVRVQSGFHLLLSLIF